MVLAMTHAGYLAVAWGVALGVFGTYAAHLLRRGKRLAAQVPPEDRRWS
jgi:hypothetical protein